MIRSMTAYSRSQKLSKAGEILWELRSLNSRYLETHIKLMDEWRVFEPEIRERIGQRLNRGKVECNLRFKRTNEASTELVLNETMSKRVIETAKLVSEQSEQLAPLGVIDILRWPGVVTEPEQDLSEISAEVMEALESALDELIETREREGAKIKSLIADRCQQMSELVTQVRAKLPEIRSGLEQKLKQKLSEIDVTADPHRFEQELVFHLQRLDVDEEVDRLQTHIDEVRQVLERNESVGRRLDFLMQELNREANTLGSKVAHMDIKGISVELKVLIEQMREQIQNIE